MSPLRSLLARVRQRLRGLWLVATLVWIAPLLAAVALALVVLGRLQPWAWTDPAAIGVALAGIAAVAVAAVALRVPDPVAARAADRGLDARDLVATALEREEADGPFDEQVRARAEELAREADLRRALPVRVRRRRLALAASLAALAVVAGVAANPQDEVRRQRAVEQARIDAAAEAVEEAATELAEELDPATEADALAELQALAEALADASSIGEAEELLDRTEAALEAGIPPESLARKAALSGLEDGLAAEPLPGAPSEGDAASQLEAAADAAGELTDEEAAELAERLERLAATQAVGNPAAAAALGEAAAALRAGDDSAAGQALRDAAAAQRAAGAASASDDARRAALGAVGSARERLAGEGEGQGEGEGEGEGQGQGAGQGQGQGEGDGQGEGQGAGQGQGGSPSGQVAGSTSGTGAGQGGQGTPGGTGDGGRDDEGARTADPAVFDPEAGRGDEVDLGGTPTGGNLGEVVGRGDGASAQGSSYVPLSQAIDRFQQRVTRALDDPALSPSMRELVRAYFTRLTEGT